MNTPETGYPANPVPSHQVTLSDQFWKPRLDLVHKKTAQHEIDQCENTLRLLNFQAAQGKGEPPHNHNGYRFNDSDVYKVIEGIAYILQHRPDPELQAKTQSIIQSIIEAQEPDGYLFTAKQVYAHGGTSTVKPERWINIGFDHELYCAGHLIESAIAWKQSTGETSYLTAAKKFADLICQEFNESGNQNPPGHQEIEIALIKLWQETGDQKYLNQAKLFLDRRGQTEGRTEANYGEYAQDHFPVTQQKEAVGHAVRAAYQYMAMADIAAHLNLPEYKSALDDIWQSVTTSKLYITGGIGSTGDGEAFGKSYELPNISAYQETCATIANMMWNQRMFQLYQDAKYIDVMELALYNGFLSGFGLDGESFFYANPLKSQGTERPEWYGCACCPPNVLRLIPTLPSWFYATTKDRIYINLYADNSAQLNINNQNITISQKTEYPYNGKIAISINPKEQTTFTIALRIPGWARNQIVSGDLYQTNTVSESPTLKVNSQSTPYSLEKGYIVINREWSPDDQIILEIPTPVQTITANPKVEANQGRIAYMRGPLVYCAEFPNNPNNRVFNLFVNPSSPTQTLRSNLNLPTVQQIITTTAQATQKTLDGNITTKPDAIPLQLTPYFAWANRGSGQMTVWLPTKPELTWPDPAPTIAATSKITTTAFDNPYAIVDQLLPANSDDHSHPRIHWWPKNNTLEDVTFSFNEPKEVSQVRVYWFDDRPRSGGCRIPESWSVDLLINGKWQSADTTNYPVSQDEFNQATFTKTTATALRLKIKLQKEWSTGIHEVEIN